MYLYTTNPKKFTFKRFTSIQEFIDESLSERLWGLTEMFPEPVRNSCGVVTRLTWNSTKVCCSYGRSGIWALASIFTIMFLPVIFENEMATMQEMQLQQQRQVCLKLYFDIFTVFNTDLIILSWSVNLLTLFF